MMASLSSKQPPRWVFCPVTLKVMATPVVVDSDCEHVVCKKTLQKWINHGDNHGKPTCPVCLRCLRSAIPLRALPELQSSIQSCIKNYKMKDYSSSSLLNDYLFQATEHDRDCDGQEEEKDCPEDQNEENCLPCTTELLVDASTDEENRHPNSHPTVGKSRGVKRPLGHVSPSPNKRLKVTKRTVRFLPDPSDASRVFAHTILYTPHPEVKKKDIWWTRTECSNIFKNEKSLYEFYQNHCSQLRDTVELIWMQCAELPENETDHSELAWKFQQSPVMGMEKRFAAFDMRRKKCQLFRAVRNLQKQGGVGLAEEIGTSIRQLSEPARRFAATMAKANAAVVQEFYKEEDASDVSI